MRNKEKRFLACAIVATLLITDMPVNLLAKEDVETTLTVVAGNEQMDEKVDSDNNTESESQIINEEGEEIKQAESVDENAAAQTLSSENYTYTESSGEITITKYTGAEENVEIPAELNGLPVTSIGRQAFANAETIKELTIPFGIKSIGREAFKNCTNLKTLYYSCELDEIGTNVYQGCSNLKTVYIGSQVSSVWRNSSNNCFGPAVEEFIVNSDNEELQSIDGIIYGKANDEGTYNLVLYPTGKKNDTYEIPENVSKIVQYAISGNPYLKTLIISGENLEISESAVINLNGLESLQLQGSISKVNRNAVRDCDSLKTVYVETDINTSATFFYGCDNLTSVNIGIKVSIFNPDCYGSAIAGYFVESGNTTYSDDDGVLYSIKDGKKLIKYPSQKADISYQIQNDTEEIETYAFRQCTYLNELTLSPEKEIQLGRYIIYNCQALETLTLSGNITQISDDSIWRCASLKTINIGKNLKNWAEISSLSDYEYLEKINVESGNSNYYSEDGILFDRECTKILVYPAAKPGKTYMVPNTVVTIGSQAFESVKNLQEIIIGDNVMTIEDRAFAECEKLTSIEIPESVTSIGRNAINCTIIGGKGSEAEKYAGENDLPFIVKDSYEQPGYPLVPDAETNIWDGKTTEEITPEGNSYFVSTGSQLAWLSEQVLSGNDFSGKTIILTADIDLESQEWTPIGNNTYPFRGNFDGRNHTVSNLKISESDYAGLFGAISSKTATQSVNIRNLVLENIEIEGAVAGGGLAGYLKAYKGAGITIENCTVNGTVSGEETGGLLGFIQGGTYNSDIVVSKIIVSCTVSNTDSGGGVVGKITSGDDTNDSYGGTVKIEDCKFKGTVTSPDGSGGSGGIAGMSEAISDSLIAIQHCRADGEIYIDEKAYYSAYAGGIVGRLEGENATVISCVNYASVTGRGYYSGGIAGGSSGKIEQCCNEGDIRSNITGGVSGGIVGELEKGGEIRDSYNTGEILENIYPFVYPGGVTGYNRGKLINCYNIGKLPEQYSELTKQCYPGGMGSVVTGATEYCYYDCISFDIAHLYGNTSKNPDIPLIYNDSSNGIIHSGGMSTAEMKTESSYTTWDFESVWEMDYDYSYGYPTLSSIKDLLEKHPDPDKKSLKDSQKKFTITVVDQDNEEIESAYVTLGNISKFTGETGQVKFDYEESIQQCLKVEKEGYIPYQDDTYVMNPIKEYTIRLVEEGKENEHPLNSVIMDLNGNRYELLTQTKTINRKYEGVEFKIYCKPSDADKTYTKYEIIQGNTVIASEEGGEFTLKPEMFQTTEKNGYIYKTIIRLTDDSGNTSEEEINLTVVDETEINSTLEFGKGIEFTVGEDVPFFGNSKIKFDTFDLPISVKMNEDKWRITLNLLDGDWDGGKEDGISVLKSESSLEKKLQKIRRYLSQGEIPISASPRITFELAGYAEGDMPMGNSDIKLQIYGKVTTKFTGEAQASIFVFAGEITGEISATGEMKWNMETAKITDGSVKFEGSVGVGIHAGIGLAYVASVGLYGNGKLGMEYYLLPSEKAGLEDLYLSGTVKAVARFLGANVAEHTLWGPETCWLYSRELDEYSLSEKSQSSEYESEEQWLQSLGDLEISTPLEMSAGIWTGKDDVLQQDAYLESKPLFMQAEGDLLMLFTSNMSDNREVADVSTLMFSVYDENTKEWSEPKPVEDDGTADFNPVVAGGYVAWNDSKSSLTECNTLNERGKKQEVSVAKYNSNTQSFGNVQTLTSNESYEGSLSLLEDGGKFILSWLVNSEDDVFGSQGKNTVYMSTLEESTWKTKKIVDIDHIVLNRTTAVLDGRTCYLYVVDENENLSDQEGQAAYLIFEDTGETEKLSDQSVTSIGYISAQNKVFWIGIDGNIYSKSGDAGKVVQETEEGTAAGNLHQVIETANGNVTLLFTQNGDNNANAYALIYDAENETWSGKISLTAEEEAYIESISGDYVNGEFVYCYNQRIVDVNSSDLNGKNSIIWNSISSGNTFLSDLAVDIITDDQRPGLEVPLEITVKNVGLTTCKSVNIVISDNTNEIMNQTVSTEIQPGETKTIEISFGLPEITDKTEYKLAVMPDNTKEKEVSTTFVVGEASYTIDRTLYCISGTYKLTASVTNIGTERGSGIIEIFDYDNPDIVYDRYSFSDLSPDEVLNYDTELNGLNWGEITYKKIGIRVVKDGKISGDIRSVVIYEDNYIPVENVSLNNTSIDLKRIGETRQLIANIMPENATNKKVSWESSNSDVVSVNDSGKITAVDEGEAKITVTVDGKSAICNVTVKEDTVTKGDVNGDGQINLIDLMLGLNHLSMKKLLTGDSFEATDIDGDGNISLTDLMRILNYVSKKSSVL